MILWLHQKVPWTNRPGMYIHFLESVASQKHPLTQEELTQDHQCHDNHRSKICQRHFPLLRLLYFLHFHCVNRFAFQSVRILVVKTNLCMYSVWILTHNLCQTYLVWYCETTLSLWLKSDPSVPLTVAPSLEAIFRVLQKQQKNNTRQYCTEMLLILYILYMST